jgi:hypothetical protein
MPVKNSGTCRRKSIDEKKGLISSGSSRRATA